MKVKSFFKRSFSLLAAVFVFAFCFVSPSFAVDSSDSLTARTMRPLFDYDFMEVYYSDGSKAVFNLKDAFYEHFLMDDELSYNLYDYNTASVISFHFQDLKLEQVPIMIEGTTVRLPYWRLIMDMSVSDIDRVVIGCSESIYDYFVLNTAYTNFRDQFNFFDSEYNTSYSNFTYSNNSLFYYPSFTFNDDGAVIGRTLLSRDISFSANNASSGYDISPNISISSLAALMPNTIGTKYIYFSDFTTDFTIPSDADILSLQICYIPTESVVTFKDYHDLYFPPYTINSDATADFAGWITTAVGGFLTFEFIPGISFGMLLGFMLGVGAFMAFLRYFAGG